MRARRLLAVGLAGVLGVTGCETKTKNPTASSSPLSPSPSSPSASTSAAPGLAATIARYGAATLAWHACDNGFECAKLTVPLDYAVPDGDTIEIAVIRLKARKRPQRIGSVVLNPGGPGGSGIEFAQQATALLPGEILDRFDTVSFDPRGVGQSAPVDCYDDAQLDTLLAVDPLPDTPAEHTRLVAANRDEARACQARSGKLLAHVATVDTAKDLDVLRTALGDEQLTYVGFSYGTLLGARYAQQFPTHIRALVLDGAVDPALSTRDLTLAQAVGFEKALAAFFADCVSRHCRFASHGGIGTTYDALMARIDRAPLASSRDSGRRVGPSEALFGVAAGLYSKEFGWPVLRTALEAAYTDHDGAGLLSLFDNLVERQNGHYSNSVEALSAISCVDGVYPRNPAAYDAWSRDFAKSAPRFGPPLAYGPLVCAYWPVPAVSAAEPIHALGAPPILVVGTTRDPATPYAWAVALAKQLAGVLLTHVGDGHTAYGYHRSDCVDRIVDAYLLTLTVPKAGTRCS